MIVLALCNDLIFRTKIESTARSLGCAVARGEGAFVEAISNGPGVVLIDLDTAWPEASALAESLSSHPAVRVVAFGSHVRKDVFEEARAAGIRNVMARSAFVLKLPTMLHAGE